MAELMSLSAEQTEKILQFQDLTGIEDMSVCRDVLQRHAWDLEVSVQEQLNMREGRPSVYSRDREPPDLVHSPPPVSDSRINQFFFSPPTTARGNRGIFSYIVSLFFRICYDTVATFLRLTFGFIRPDPRRFITDPVGDVLKFINSFEEKYGSRHPVFYQGTYSQALNDAKRELRFLLIYLHCEDHQDTDSFCRNTLSDMEVVTYVNTNMLFWGCSVTTPEGYRVSQALRENGYPFLAVICLRENRMTVVGRLEGSVNPQELIHRLQAIVQENEAALIAARAERVERNFNQTLRQQQDQAYLESLRADEEKERRRCQERERLADEERSRREQEQAELNRLEEIRRQKVEFMNRIPDEPDRNHPDAVHIVIKLPDGTRLERRFLRSHTLDAVYYYIFCHPSSPVSFEVATNFPKRVLQCSPGPDGTAKQTLAEAGLIRREVLFVYDLDA